MVSRPWPSISTSSSPIRVNSSLKVWGRNAIMFAAISSQSPALGSKIRCSAFISHQAGLLKVLAEHGPGDEAPMIAPTMGARNSTTSIPVEERAARVFT